MKLEYLWNSQIFAVLERWEPERSEGSLHRSLIEPEVSSVFGNLSVPPVLCTLTVGLLCTPAVYSSETTVRTQS